METTQARRTSSGAGRSGIAAAVIAAVFATSFAAASAQAAAFLKLAGIDGESTVEAHRNEIEILGFDQALIAALQSGPWQGTGKAGCPSMSLIKNLDRASVALIKVIVGGKHISDGVLSFQRGGLAPVDYYKIQMQDIQLAEVSQSSGPPDAGRVTERVVLTARKFTFEYRQQDDKGGLADPVKTSWDCVTGAVL